jgi:hypothetical protein
VKNVKKKSRMEMDREILSSVKKEMARPRLAASVRDDREAEAALSVKERLAHAAKV